MKLVTIFGRHDLCAERVGVYRARSRQRPGEEDHRQRPESKRRQSPRRRAKAETRVVKTETRAAKTHRRKRKPAPRRLKRRLRGSRARSDDDDHDGRDANDADDATVKNPKLEARLLTLLPAGTNIQDASQGFKNWGQFVAAVHVSNNLGIPFADLKAAMTGLAPGATPGTTVPTTTPMSLGQAIQSLKGTTTTAPGTLSSTKIQNEVKKAEDAANR